MNDDEYKKYSEVSRLEHVRLGSAHRSIEDQLAECEQRKADLTRELGFACERLERISRIRVCLSDVHIELTHLSRRA